MENAINMKDFMNEPVVAIYTDADIIREFCKTCSKKATVDYLKRL